MDLSLDETQQMILDTARRFAEQELLPIAAKIDKTGEFPHKQVRQLAELGFLGMAVPDQWGGAGLDVVSYAIAIEEISAGCASTGVIMSVNNSLVCDPIWRYGNDEQRRRYLTPLAQGKRLGCFALSEPGSGSDAAGMRCTAIRDGDHYVVNGTKNWITNGSEADVCVLIAHTNPAERHKGISALIVDRKETPYHIGKVEEKLGIKGSSTCSLVFEDVRVPVVNRLGNEGDGFKVAMSTLDGGRIGIAAQALGIARQAYVEALQYSRERAAFGKPIGDFGAIQEMLADMATEIDAARLLIWRAADAKDRGEKYGKLSAMAKLYASEMSARVTHKALQIHGGYGYVKEYPAERHVRDARITEIYEGTSEIQRLVVARETLQELGRLMDFALAPADQEVATLARGLATGVLAEHADAVDGGQFPLTGLRAVADAGLMGAKLPPEFGGKSVSNLAFCHVIHELAKVCASTAVTVSVTNMVADMIWKFGTPAQHERWLRPIAGGEFPAAAFALSEPSAGSDAGSLRTRATKVDGGWQLDGQKLWITSGDRAGVTLVMAKTDPTAGARGITAFLVPAGTPGFEIGRHEEKLGLRGSSTVGLAFQSCVVPDDAVLGGLGMGFTIAMTALDGGRCTIGAQALGMGYRALEGAAKHLKARTALDKAAGTDQPVQFRLADMAMRLDAGWLLVQRAAWLRDAGKPMTREAAMAKVNATEAAGFACQTALQLVGAAALDGSHPVARAWRDVRVSRIYEGTSEIQRLVIARSLVPAGRA